MNYKKIVSLSISLCTIICVLFIIVRHWNEFTLLFFQVNTYTLTWICLTQICLITSSGLPFKTLYSVLGIEITTMDWISMSFAGNLANYTAPFRPSLAVRYVFMKCRYQSTLTDIAIVTAAYSLFTFIIAICLIITLNLVTPPKHHLTHIWIFFLLLVTLVIIAGTNKLASLDRLATILPNKASIFLDNLRSFKCSPKLCLQLAPQFIAINILGGIAYFFAFKALGISTNIPTLLMIAPLTTLAGWFSLTPANIGVTETLVGALLEYSSGDFSVGFLATSIVRLTHIGVSIFLGSISSFYLMSKINSTNSA